MAQIQKLSADMIGLIAAGEVVERPASVVKELVENSIDAGASSITVELRQGGNDYIRITDNGCGIPPEQIRLAFERHATSKISDPKDLFALQTLGFRGEALPSVAAVARVTLTTAVKGAPSGTRALVEGGEFKGVEEAASPTGTGIVVEKLFANVPARLKFLKTPRQEASYAADYMTRLILSRPDISFRFINQGKTVYRSPGDGKAASAIIGILGRECFAAMKPVRGSMGGVLVSGYVGVGEHARGNHGQQFFFVNGRSFSSPALSHAVDEACSGRVMVGRFPVCVLYLELPGDKVDVNVHPNKLQVRFANESAVTQAVCRLVQDALSPEQLGSKLIQAAVAQPVGEKESNPVSRVQIIDLGSAEKKAEAGEPVLKETAEAPKPVMYGLSPIAGNAPVSTPAKEGAESPKPITYGQNSAAKAASAPVVYGQSPYASAPSASSVPESPAFPSLKEKGIEYNVSSGAKKPIPETQQEQQTLLSPKEEASPGAALRYIGSAFDTYMIFEGADRVLVLDQHAAHERILYDKYLSMITNGRATQYLLSPQVVHLGVAEMLRLKELMPVLAESGFDLSVFDEQNVALRAVPMLFGVEASPRELLLEAIDEWEGGRRQVTSERMQRRVAQMACKHAVKGGDKLNEKQVAAFLDTFLKSDSCPTCPHGRPIVIEITRRDLEKRFSRIQG